MRKLFFQAFTGKDNATVDIGRVLWAGMVVLFGALECRSVFGGNEFHSMEFAQAAGIILTAGGISLGIKAHTEPGAP